MSEGASIRKAYQAHQRTCERRAPCRHGCRSQSSGSIIIAVMLGAIAGCGRLPLRLEAIRGGHSRGWQGGRQQSERLPCRLRCRSRENFSLRSLQRKRRRPPQRLAFVEHGGTYISRRRAGGQARGIRRLINYQNVAYGRLYLDRLRSSSRTTRRPARKADYWEVARTLRCACLTRMSSVLRRRRSRWPACSALRARSCALTANPFPFTISQARYRRALPIASVVPGAVHCGNGGA